MRQRATHGRCLLVLCMLMEGERITPRAIPTLSVGLRGQSTSCSFAPLPLCKRSDLARAGPWWRTERRVCSEHLVCSGKLCLVPLLHCGVDVGQQRESKVLCFGELHLQGLSLWAKQKCLGSLGPPGWQKRMASCSSTGAPSPTQAPAWQIATIPLGIHPTHIEALRKCSE